jgi:hypothetical protein
MTDEQIIEMAKKLGFERMRIDHDYYVCFSKEIVELAKVVARHELEVCATFIERLNLKGYKELAELIRARGEE